MTTEDLSRIRAINRALDKNTRDMERLARERQALETERDREATAIERAIRNRAELERDALDRARNPLPLLRGEDARSEVRAAPADRPRRSEPDDLVEAVGEALAGQDHNATDGS